MTPIRETIARVYVETIIGKPDPDWAAHWQWYLDGAGNPDSCVHYSNHGRGAQHADAVLRALDEAGCVVVRKDEFFASRGREPCAMELEWARQQAQDLDLP
jgi:hypothetical protein